MAGLLYNKFFITLCTMVVLCHSAQGYESSFPFPFEFGHSSDIYLKVKPMSAKEENKNLQAANELLVQKGYSKEPAEVLNYIKRNNIEAVKLALDAGLSPNVTIYGTSALYYATKYKRYEILKLLFDNGANQQIEINSILKEAILNKDIDCAKLLIQNGADINYYDGIANETLLYTTLKKKEYEIARLLIENGAKVDERSGNFIKKNKLDMKCDISID